MAVQLINHGGSAAGIADIDELAFDIIEFLAQ